jgi:hypothetical protein
MTRDDECWNLQDQKTDTKTGSTSLSLLRCRNLAKSASSMNMVPDERLLTTLVTARIAFQQPHAELHSLVKLQ